MLAFTLATSGLWLAEQIDPPLPSLLQQAGDVLGELKERGVAKLRGRPAQVKPPPVEPSRTWPAILGASTLLGAAGCCLGGLGFARGEAWRTSAVACAFGGFAIAYPLLLGLAVVWIVVLAVALAVALAAFVAAPAPV